MLMENEVFRQLMLMFAGIGIGVLTYICFTFCYCHATVILSIKNLSLKMNMLIRFAITFFPLILMVLISGYVAVITNGYLVRVGTIAGLGMMTYIFVKNHNFFYILLSDLWAKYKFGVRYKDTKDTDKLIETFNHVKLKDLYLYLFWLQETHGMKKRDWENIGVFKNDFQNLLNNVPSTLFDSKVLDCFNNVRFNV